MLSPRPTLPRFDQIALSLAVLLLDAGFLSSRYNFDGTVFALRVERALVLGDPNSLGELLHPRHLLYEPLGYLFCRAAGALGLHFRTIFLLQFLNVLFGVLSLALFHRIAFRLSSDRWLAAAATLMLAFSFGFWIFSIEAEVYVSGVCFLLLAFRSLLHRADSPSRPSSWITDALVLAAFGALALANHLTFGLFLIPLGLESLLYSRRPRKSWRSGLAPALLFSATALGLAGIAYLLAARMHPAASTLGFRQWVIGPANPETPYGYRQSYWASGLHSFPDFGRGMLHLFCAEPYPDSGAGVPVAIAAAWFLAWLLILGLYFRNARALWKEDSRTQVLVLGWLIPSLVWNWSWQPINFELKVAMLAPLLLWAGITLSREKIRASRAWPGWLLAAMALLLLGYNFFAAILPGSRPENNRDLQRARSIGEATEPNAAVFIAGSGPGYNLGKIYLPYFSRREAKVADWLTGPPGSPFPARLQAALTQLRQQRRPAYVLSELLEPTPALQVLALHHRVSPESIRRVFQGHRPRLKRTLDPELSLYRLEE